MYTHVLEAGKVESACRYSNGWTVQKAVCVANRDFSVQWKCVAFSGKEEDVASLKYCLL
jgi:hypothetical protein